MTTLRRRLQKAGRNTESLKSINPADILFEKNIPGDSSRDLLIPKRWRSPTTFEKGHVNSPSQKGHDRRITRLVGLFIAG